MESEDSYNIPSTPAVVPDGQNLNIYNNHSATNQAPFQEPSHYQASADSGRVQQQSEDNDVLMDFDDYDAMPALQDVSDSDHSESDRDAHEVEMEVDSEVLPPLLDATDTLPDPSSISAYRSSAFEATVRTNGSRRARVEDDDDDERDRRHPSQRIRSADRNVASATSPSFLPFPDLSQDQIHIPANQSTPGPANQGPTPAPLHHHVLHATLTGNLPNNHPFNFFHHIASPNNNTNNNPVHNHNEPAVLDNNQPPPQQPYVAIDGANGRSLFGEMSFSVEIGPGLNIHATTGPDEPSGPAPQNADGQPPPVANTARPPRTVVTDILGMLGQLRDGLGGGETIINLGNLGFGSQEKDDPERAQKLVDGLEVVPVGLVRRLERIGGIGLETGEEPTNGGDAGCAICWDKLLDADGEGFGKEERAAIDEANKESGSSSEPQLQQSKIVSLPCAHVFHADCLLPWFARPKHTTCPTCRFNIDPQDLTHASMRRRRESTERNASQASQTDGEPLPAQLEDGNDLEVPANEGDDSPPNVAFLHGGDFDGPPANLFFSPNEIHDRLRELFGQHQRQRDPAGTTAVNPIPAASTNDTTTVPGPSNNEPLPFTNGTGSNTSTEPNPPPAAAMPPRMPNISSTIIPTPHGRMGVIQVPVPVMIPFPFSATTPGQTPTPAAAPNVPNGPRLPPMDPTAPHTHTQEIARMLRQLLRRGAPQTPQPQQAAQTADGGNTTPAPSAQNGLPETNVNVPPTANGTQGEGNNNSNHSGAATDQFPRQAVMEIRVDMVFGQDPLAGLINGGNSQAGQPPFDVNEVFRNEFQNVVNAHAEGRQLVDADFMARHQELQQRLVSLLEMRRRLETGLTSAGFPLPPGYQQLPPGFQLPFQQRAEQNPNIQLPHQQPPPPQQQQQPQQPHIAPFETSLHFTGTGRSVSEAFAQMLGRMRPPTQQEQADLDGPPRTENDQQPGQPSTNETNNNIPQQTAPAGNAPPPFGFPNLADLFGDFMRARRWPRPFKDWTLPPAPGPTLRQRVERREREAGLRCHDVSCGLGPSDEDPFGVELGHGTGDMKQLSIMSKEDRSELCTHTFHGSCLVSAERVALRGAEAVIEDGNVEVSCPVCRGTGCVSKKDWEEGVVSLQ